MLGLILLTSHWSVIVIIAANGSLRFITELIPADFLWLEAENRTTESEVRQKPEFLFLTWFKFGESGRKIIYAEDKCVFQNHSVESYKMQLCNPVFYNIDSSLIYFLSVCFSRQRTERRKLRWRPRPLWSWSLSTIQILKTRSTTPPVPSRFPQIYTKAVSYSTFQNTSNVM